MERTAQGPRKKEREGRTGRLEEGWTQCKSGGGKGAMEETELGRSPGKDEPMASFPSLINPVIEQTLKDSY